MRAARGIFVLACVNLAACVAPSADAPAQPATVVQPAVSSVQRTGAQIGLAYPHTLYTHCGLLSTEFDNRTFYVDDFYPARVPRGDRSNRYGDPKGTMTLLSEHVAEYLDLSGYTIRFVDYYPAEEGRGYPLQVHVLSGGNRLLDVLFAGRQWHTDDTLPGVIGPPYGDGRDRFTVVAGTYTILSADRADFVSAAGARLRFTRLGPQLCM
jgi:hypothetical protein